ncbi:MAG: hypothetical protein IJU92_09115 [Spirochaetaceae bacterium]|nr:hypothetical protein [Spirochaetaceae bacterium]
MGELKISVKLLKFLNASEKMGFLGGTPKPRFRKERVPKGKETLVLGQKGVFSLRIRMQKTIPAKTDFPVLNTSNIDFFIFVKYTLENLR